jgi:hypothetical protein
LLNASVDERTRLRGYLHCAIVRQRPYGMHWPLRL